MINKTPYFMPENDCNELTENKTDEEKESFEASDEFDTPDYGVDKAYSPVSGGIRTTDISNLYGEQSEEIIPAITNDPSINGDCEPCKRNAESSEELDPEDEQAATCDDCGCTEEAQQKCALDDYEIISDVLGCEKQLVKLYSTALCESAEEPLRNAIRENLIECASDQYETFEFMQERGMYKTEQAEKSDIDSAKTQFGSIC